MLAATAALPHRRCAAVVVGHLIERLRWAKLKGFGRAFFTHCNLAAARNGAQHRNTSRAIVNELSELGFIDLADWQPGRPGASQTWKPYRFRVNMAAVWAWLNDRGLKPMGHNAHTLAAAAGTVARSAADWWAERSRVREERVRAAQERAEAQKAAEAAERRRRDEEAARAAAEPIDHLAVLEASVAAMDAKGITVPGFMRRNLANLRSLRGVQG